MAIDVFKIKKNDKNPPIAVALQYNDGTAVDLTDSTPYFIMAHRDYTPYFSGACVITGSATGQVEYRWTGTTDTGSVGIFWGEFEVNWTGSKMTLPSDHNLQIHVYEDYN